jgi:hypothetical protein
MVLELAEKDLVVVEEALRLAMNLGQQAYKRAEVFVIQECDIIWGDFKHSRDAQSQAWTLYALSCGNG